MGVRCAMTEEFFRFVSFHFYFPAPLVRGFFHSDMLERPWSLQLGVSLRQELVDVSLDCVV